MNEKFVAVGAIWYLAFLLSTVCHEAAHALVAHWGGDSTAFHGGQVTLDPLPHIRREPVGTIVAPILSYIFAHWMIGWASAPYDPAWQKRHPRRAAWMALAGPAANFILALLAAAAIHVGMAAGIFREPVSIAASYTNITEAAAPGLAGFAAVFLSVLFVLNVLLGTFNLIPVPPLDGNTGITVFMGRERALRFIDWTHSQLFGMAGILLAWVLYDKVFDFIFRLSLAALYPGTRWG
ncbi:MAG TPA: site-2 protease family protein [Candidatus Acidoferrales bacterium]|nr:site-2 protease family protein [Candidatus Acidoferrales bacterium]